MSLLTIPLVGLQRTFPVTSVARHWLVFVMAILVVQSTVAAPPPIVDEHVKRIESELVQREIKALESIHLNISRSMATETGNAERFLRGSLSVLQASESLSRHEIDPSLQLRRMARFRWSVEEGETITAAIARHKREPRLPGCRNMGFNNYQTYLEEHRRLSDRAMPTDWSPRREFWLSLVNTIIQAKATKNPSEIWKRKIQDDALNANWYRFAYLEVQRTIGRGVPDFEIVQPLLDDEILAPIERLRRICLIASTMTSGWLKRDVDKRRLKEMQQQVIDLLRTTRIAPDDAVIVRDALSVYFGHAERVNQTLLTRTLLQNQPTLTATRLFAAIGLSDKTRRRMFLARQTALNIRNLPLRQTISLLSKQVRLPLWIDGSIDSGGTSITLNAKGTWVEMLDAVLAQTEFRASVLRHGIIWIGPQSRKAEAIALLNNAEARSLQSNRLDGRGDYEFRDTPWKEALAFIGHRHGISVIPRWCNSQKKTTITLKMIDIPAFLVLGIIANRVQVEWAVTAEVVSVVPTERLAELQQFEQKYQRRLVSLKRLELDNNWVVGRLRDPTECEFDDVSINDAIEFLSDLNDVDIMMVEVDRALESVTFELSDTTLSWALTLLLAERGTTWDIDDERIVIGEAKTLLNYKRRVNIREKLRKSYPVAISQGLQKPITLNVREANLKSLQKKLSAAIGTKVVFDVEAKKTSKKTTTFFADDEPVAAVLDLIAAHLDLTWNVTDRGEVFMESVARSTEE